ncbi:MAG: TonB-dependent receptor [Acidobacteriota bacterium]
MVRKFGAALAVAVASLVIPFSLLAQTVTGAISGHVKDENGRPIAGAVVEVTSSYLQGARSMATDEDGDFLIAYLPPAHDYAVSIHAEGYSKVIQSRIRVALGTTTTLQVVLSGTGTSLEVRATPSLLDLKDSKISTDLSQETLQSLPIGRQFQQAFYLVPNVVDSGLTLEPGNPGVAGSTASENVFIVDGLNITDPVGGVLASNFNYNFVREIQVTTAGASAEYGPSTGGLFNILTKSGSNEFHGEVFGYYTNESLAASARTPGLSLDLSTPQPFHNYDYGFDLGGPILKDHVWFFVGFNPTLRTQHFQGLSVVQNVYTGQTHLLPYRYDDLSKDWLGLAKFTFRANDRHNFELNFITDPTHGWLNEGVGNTGWQSPTVPSVQPDSQRTRRYLTGYSAGLRWFANWTDNFYQESEIAHVHTVAEILPWNQSGYGEPQIINNDWAPAVSVGNGTGTLYWDTRDRTQISSKVTYLVHRNEIKFGFEWEDLKWDSYNGYTGGVQYTVQGGFPGTNPFSPNLRDYAYVIANSLQNPHSKDNGRYIAGFAQTKWSATDYLTLAAGLRWEHNELMPSSAQSASFNSFSPRVGLSWDFMHDGKSKFYMNWGRYYDRLPIAATYLMDPGHEQYTDVTYLGQPVSHYVFGAAPLRVLGGTKNQYNDEFLVGAEYEPLPNLLVGFNAIYRELGRVLEDVGYFDSQGRFSFLLMNPGSSQWPAIMQGWARILPDYERFPNPIRHYSGYTLNVERRFTHRWFLNASYTLSFLQGNYEGGSGGYGVDALAPTVSTAYDFPEHILNMNRYGWLPEDVRNNFKLQASYRFDWGLLLGLNFNARSGRPYDKLFSYPLSGPGYGTIFAAPRGSDRLPGVWQLDLHAQYDIKIWRSALSLFFDLFNVTNRQTALTVDQNYYLPPATLSQVFSGQLIRDPNWGRSTSLQAPRSFQIGMKWSF